MAAHPKMSIQICERRSRVSKIDIFTVFLSRRRRGLLLTAWLYTFPRSTAGTALHISAIPGTFRTAQPTNLDLRSVQIQKTCTRNKRNRASRSQGLFPNMSRKNNKGLSCQLQRGNLPDRTASDSYAITADF